MNLRKTSFGRKTKNKLQNENLEYLHITEVVQKLGCYKILTGTDIRYKPSKKNTYNVVHTLSSDATVHLLKKFINYL